jgi:hypothetical protein
MSVSIGKVYAICDHCEKSFGVPVSARIIKETIGIGRTELRKLVRQGRLDEFDVTEPNGVRRKGYARPQTNE